MPENNAKEIQVVTIKLPNGDEIEQCVIRESSSGLYFCVDASFIEQHIDNPLSPYGNGELFLPS